MALFKANNEEHPMLKMPDIETDHAAGYLIGLLQEAGLMSSNGMGPVPISWQEIYTWLSVTQLKLSNWEVLTLKSLSEEYVSELIQATAKDRPAPYSIEVVEKRKIVNDKIFSVLGRFMRKD
jgi:hypothetical protein